MPKYTVHRRRYYYTDERVEVEAADHDAAYDALENGGDEPVPESAGLTYSETDILSVSEAGKLVATYL